MVASCGARLLREVALRDDERLEGGEQRAVMVVVNVIQP